MDEKSRLAAVFTRLIELGRLTECAGLDGSSPVSNLVRVAEAHGVEALANINTGINGIQAPINETGRLRLFANRGVLNGEPPLALRVGGDDEGNYRQFVIKANEMLVEERFQSASTLAGIKSRLGAD